MRRLTLKAVRKTSGGARRRRRRQPPTASRLKGPRKQKSFAYKLLKRGLAKSFAYKLLKRGLANLMAPTSTSGVAPPLRKTSRYYVYRCVFVLLAFKSIAVSKLRNSSLSYSSSKL
ncbi:hypothetical protein EVAR_21981_1 [Eumeta japonica]|uniref:Uncharacterized protein n=1 Tax=Eumeta variegata TaxID=151549 RepID=A0A4C1VY18_EUMVA|nr:hypothetical protein EVAR_21981_1 [Eumeta japonica]